jgi:hypothetical protein
LNHGRVPGVSSSGIRGGCAVPGAWRIVQIAQALHKKAQFCTFGSFQWSGCVSLGVLGEAAGRELALQKVQIAHSTFAHFGKLHKICPNAFPCPQNLSRSTIESKKRKNCTSSRVSSS